MKSVSISGVSAAVMMFAVTVTMHEASRADRLVSQTVPPSGGEKFEIEVAADVAV